MYRKNDSNMSIQDQIDDLNKRIDGMKQNPMNAQQQYNVSMARNIIGGIVLFLLVCVGGACNCNRTDNLTQLEISRICPERTAVSKK